LPVKASAGELLAKECGNHIPNNHRNKQCQQMFTNDIYKTLQMSRDAPTMLLFHMMCEQFFFATA